MFDVQWKMRKLSPNCFLMVGRLDTVDRIGVDYCTMGVQAVWSWWSVPQHTVSIQNLSSSLDLRDGQYKQVASQQGN